MFRPQLIQAVVKNVSKHIPIRGIASYEFPAYGDPDEPNYHLIQHLIKEMQREEGLGGNVFKVRAFATAIKSIHELDVPLREIPGVGDGIARRIMEFIGAPRKEDYRAISFTDQKDALKDWAMQELQRINGIGPVKARALVESGCMSLAQLHEERFLKMLPQAVQTSAIYQKDIGERVTKQQAEAFMASMGEVVPLEVKSHLVGSYRRGHPTSSEINILIFHPSYNTLPDLHITGSTSTKQVHHSHANAPPNLLQDSVIAPLTENGITVATLSSGPSRWQGLVKIQSQTNEVIRKADLYLMPQASAAPAFLAFTGDALFNSDCRKRARERGMYLNQFGLWRHALQETPRGSSSAASELKRKERTAKDTGEHLSQEDPVRWELVETPDEAALLLELGMGYITPERRNMANLSVARKDVLKKSGLFPWQDRLRQTSRSVSSRSGSKTSCPADSRSHDRRGE